MKKPVSLGTAVLLALVLFLALWQVRPVLAAPINVTTTVDENDNNCGDGDCSLRDAIATAVAGDEIIIPAGTYNLTLGQIVIDKDLTLRDAAGVNPVIGNGSDRSFAVTSGASVTFLNLTITGNTTGVNGAGIYVATTGGTVVVEGTTVANNSTSVDGGGIYVAAGTVRLLNSTIADNTAVHGGGVYVDGGAVILESGQIRHNAATDTSGVAGGGVYVGLATFTMSGGGILTNTANTTAQFPGGGVAVAGGTANLNAGKIRGNIAYRGGGVMASSGSVNVAGTDILSNTATFGGGIYIRNTDALVAHSSGRIDYNIATASSNFGGGGIYLFRGGYSATGGSLSHNTSAFDGGALHVASGTAMLDGMTISGNITASTGGALGGALHVRGNSGVLNVSNSTLSGNVPNAMTTEGGPITAKGNAIDNHTTALVTAGSASLTAYANNITNYTTGFSDSSSGSHSVRHNWWGGSATAVSVGDADGFAYRLGAPVVEWGEGSLADGAAISGGTGTGVVVDHGTAVPFGIPASLAGSPCSGYYDFFTAPGASGSWTVSIPVSSAAACDTTFNDTKLFHFALNGSGAPDTACSPAAACWQAYGGVSGTAGSPRLLNAILTTAALGGTPIVAGNDSGNDPTAVSLATISASSSAPVVWPGLVLLLVLFTAGLLWQRRPRAVPARVRRQNQRR